MYSVESGDEKLLIIKKIVNVFNMRTREFSIFQKLHEHLVVHSQPSALLASKLGATN